MDLLKEKRDYFRVEIRRSQHNQIFNKRRQFHRQQHIEQDDVLSMHVIQDVISNLAANYQSFCSKLEILVDQDEEFPLNLLQDLLKSDHNSQSLCVITKLINHMYQKGVNDQRHFVLYLKKPNFTDFLKQFLTRRLDQTTSAACVQLVSAAFYASKELNQQEFLEVQSSVTRLQVVVDMWTKSNERDWVYQSLIALEAISSRPICIEKIVNSRNILQLTTQNDLLIQEQVLKLIGSLCLHGNNHNIEILIKQGLLKVLEQFSKDVHSKFRKFTFWTLSNIIIYEAFLPIIIQDHMKLIQNCLDSLIIDEYYVVKDCIYVFKNMLGNTNMNIQQFESKSNFIEKLCMFFQREYLDKDIVNACLVQFEILVKFPEYQRILQQKTDLISKLHNFQYDQNIEKLLSQLE